MSLVAPIVETADTTVADTERSLRIELAAAFRIAARMGWNEGVANHFSLVLPGQADRFLLNPRGLHFREITASRLLVVDRQGKLVRGSGQIRPVAFVLHGRLHEALPQAACILHAHPPYATALSMIKGGRLLAAHANAMMFHGDIAYDDDLGGALDDAECDRILGLVGNRSVLFHAMHGVTVMAPTVAEAFDKLYFLERTCMYQFIAQQAGQPLHSIPDAVSAGFVYDDGFQPGNRQVHFDAHCRLLDREEPDYRT